jgi:hypothetical protein|tara:strand:- start:8762 stop:8917 length:156 start_codon:yes stop_codon:yes gene_type:complete
MSSEQDPELDLVEPMTLKARCHRRIIFAVMLLFCAVPIILLLLKLPPPESP